MLSTQPPDKARTQAVPCNSFLFVVPEEPKDHRLFKNNSNIIIVEDPKLNITCNREKTENLKLNY